MPWWMSRLGWLLRRKRLVRLHLEVTDGQPSTVEGVRLGVWGGHYVLMLPKVLEAADRTHALDGVLEVPRGRVIFCQVLS
mgnify:CR=1 FL=1